MYFDDDNLKCQKCFKIGHSIYNCKNKEVYLYRPSLTTREKYNLQDSEIKIDKSELPKYKINYIKKSSYVNYKKIKKYKDRYQKKYNRESLESFDSREKKEKRKSRKNSDN